MTQGRGKGASRNNQGDSNQNSSNENLKINNRRHDNHPTAIVCIKDLRREYSRDRRYFGSTQQKRGQEGNIFNPLQTFAYVHHENVHKQ